MDINDIRKISVVIPAFNEEAYIAMCLRAINEVDTLGIEREIIVVDNGSTDATIALSQAFGAKVISKKKGTIASLRNFGAKHAEGDILVFLDADCILARDFIVKALKLLSEDDNRIIGFRMTIPEHSNWVAKSWDLLFSRRNVTIEAEWIPSGNMVMTREAFLSVNGFNETLETNEDYDFCFRIRKHGYRVFSCAESFVIHLRPPRNLIQIFKKELWHGKDVFKVFVEDIVSNRDMNIFRRKNFKVVFYAICYLIFLALIIASALVSLSTGNVLPFLLALGLPLLSSLLLALTYMRSMKNRGMLWGMTILLTAYGFSRAIGLLPYDKIKIFFVKQE